MPAKLLPPPVSSPERMSRAWLPPGKKRLGHSCCASAEMPRSQSNSAPPAEAEFSFDNHPSPSATPMLHCRRVMSHSAALTVNEKMGHWCDMAREDHQMRIRVPADLEVQIRIAAGQNGRSMNAEIIHRLERSFDGRDAIGYEAASVRFERTLDQFKSIMDRIPLEDVLDFLEAKDAEREGKKKGTQ